MLRNHSYFVAFKLLLGTLDFLFFRNVVCIYKHIKYTLFLEGWQVVMYAWRTSILNKL